MEQADTEIGMASWPLTCLYLSLTSSPTFHDEPKYVVVNLGWHKRLDGVWVDFALRYQTDYRIDVAMDRVRGYADHL